MATIQYQPLHLLYTLAYSVWYWLQAGCSYLLGQEKQKGLECDSMIQKSAFLFGMI